jgi:hypothetical protein
MACCQGDVHVRSRRRGAGLALLTCQLVLDLPKFTEFTLMFGPSCDLVEINIMALRNHYGLIQALLVPQVIVPGKPVLHTIGWGD